LLERVATAPARGLEGWDLGARWEDDRTRDVILLDVPAHAVRPGDYVERWTDAAPHDDAMVGALRAKLRRHGLVLEPDDVGAASSLRTASTLASVRACPGSRRAIASRTSLMVGSLTLASLRAHRAPEQQRGNLKAERRGVEAAARSLTAPREIPRSPEKKPRGEFTCGSRYHAQR